MDERIFRKQHVIMPARTYCPFLQPARLIFRFHGLKWRKSHALNVKSSKTSSKFHFPSRLKSVIREPFCFAWYIFNNCIAFKVYAMFSNDCGLVLTGHGLYTDRSTHDGNRRSLYRSLSATNPENGYVRDFCSFVWTKACRDISQLMENG